MISIYQIQVEKKYSWFILLGLFLSLGVQLYMPAYFLILPVMTWWLFKIRLKHLKWSLLGILSFILAFLPFLVFQFQNQFTDFKNLILFFVEKLSLSSTPPVINPIALLSQQFRAILAMGPSWLILILAAIIIFLPLIKGKNRWQQFFLFWFLTGILVLTFYPGLTPPHYASFIWVLPFLLLAAFLSLIKKPKLLFIAGFVLVFINLIVYVKNFSPTNDLARSQAVSQLISQKAENQAFGILLLSNRSPSDAHFRYFLKLIDAPVISLKQNPNRLFLICTQINCPSENEVQKMKIIETECLPSCPKLSEQKSVNLNDWQYQEYFEASGVKIFYFKAADIGPA